MADALAVTCEAHSPLTSSRFVSECGDESDRSAGSYILNPHPLVASQFARCLKWQKVSIFFVMIALLVAAQVMMSASEFKYESQAVPHWKVFTVFSGSFFMVLLMVLGLPCEAVLLTGAAFYGIFGIIDCNDVLGGLADGTVTSVALLFVMAKAISDTGVLNTFIGKVLGSPHSVRTAVFRLYILVGLLSAVVNNTPMIAMMLPILSLWCRRLGFNPAQLALPMGFASQLGGSLTLMGSPTNFAAKSAFAKAGYTLGFFELTGAAIIMFFFGLVFMVIFAPILLGRGEADVDEQADDIGPPLAACFEVSFTVLPRGVFDGLKVSQAGFTRLPGVRLAESLVRNREHINLKEFDETMVGGDRIVVRASAEGVVALRAIHGLQLPYEADLQRLGAKRRKRLVFEVQLLETSDLIGSPLSTRDFCFTHKCGLLAVRKQVGKLDDTGLRYATSWLWDTPTQDTEQRRNSVARLSMNNYIPTQGDIFLVEANYADVDCGPWLRDFGLVRKIPNSTPPRFGRWQDTMRSVMAIFGSVLAVSLYVLGDVAEQPYNSSFQNLTLTNNLLVLVALLLISKTFTMDEVYQSMDISVLMTIVGAFPFGLAIESVGLAEWTAKSLVHGLAPAGNVGIFVAIYVVSAGLSNLISNIAVIVMMVPVCASIAHLQGIAMRTMSVLVTLAASAVFTCPIGHQTNLMVWPVGKYSWGDFFRFGSGWQFLHMVLCVCACFWVQ